METNYKTKYQQLKAKFMNAVDTAFRLGFEQGKMQAEQDQMMQAQQQQAELEAAQAGMQPGGQPGQPGAEGQPGEAQQEPGQTGEAMPEDSAHPEGSELDQHIAKLEGMLGKSEEGDKYIKVSIEDLKKIKIDMASKAAFNREMKKSAAAIPAIAKALHKPAFKIGVQATANMNDSAKKAVSMQEKIVTDIFKAWDNESTKATNSIADIINVEGLTKKE